MDPYIMRNRTLKRILYLICISILILAGCKPLSTYVKGHDCKMNGSFESLKTGLPVNWWYYNFETAPKEFDILSDSILFKEGKRSLKFEVRKCESKGGWHSPGFFAEFKVQPGETYKVSFWIINKGCDFKVSIGAGMEGNPGPTKTLIRTQEPFSEWKYFEYYFEIPAANDNIRFEANILSPGIIWFDDIKIEGMNDNSELKLYPYRGNEECE
jgi:hypothetical protein